MSSAIERLFLCMLLLGTSSIALIAQNNQIDPSSMAYGMEEYQQAKEYLDTRKYPEAEKLIVIVLKKLKKEGRTKDYIEMLNLHAKSIMHQWRTEESLEIYKQMKSLAKEANLNQLHSNAIHAIMVTNEFLGNYDTIEELVSEGIQLEGLSQADYSNYYMTYGEIWKRKNNIDSALYYGKIAYDIDKEINDSISLPKTCQVISFMYSADKNYNKALEYLIEGKSYIKGDTNYKHAYFNGDIAEVMIQIRNIEKAKYYAEESVKICRINNLTSGLSDKLSLLASIEEIEGNYDKALQHYTEALELNKKPKKIKSQIRLKSGIIACKLNLAQKINHQEVEDLITLKEKTDNESSKFRIDLLQLRYLTENDISISDYRSKSAHLKEKFTESDNLYDLRNLSKLSYDFYTKKGQYNDANIALSLYMNYKDEIFEETQEFKILELETKYNKVQDEKIIGQLALTNKLQANTLKQQTVFLITASAGFLIISLLSFFLYKYYRKVKNQNEIVSNALKEKDFLLREIHHRVKNNLQVISSLLSLQARQIDDEGIQKAINEGRNRVRSMALIHQNLYQNENLTGVRVEKYLSKLLEELFGTYNVNPDRIKLKLDIEDIELDVDTMVPFGLILNELVSNCLKHAFPNDTHGTITISLKDIQGVLYLSVKDNGIGIDQEQMVKSKSFGNRLITAFTKKLHADLEVINENGTHVNLKIKNYKKAS